MASEVRELIRTYAPAFPIRQSGRLVHDTSEFMSIDYGDVIAIGGRHYLVLRDECERRFGLEDPKYWVKRCKELETGKRAILKLVFHETFPLKLGDFVITCHRSPIKEARILNLVLGDERFMQGRTFYDRAGNAVRVLEVIFGRRVDTVVEAMECDHETYFRHTFPALLDMYLGAVEAIGFLHAHGEQHGDIRRDHLWVEHGTGHYRWIDFDYAFDFHENPFGLDLFGLGNILLFLVGKGEHTLRSLAGARRTDVLASLTEDDFSLMFAYRVANLRKIFPYIPAELNNVLLHFAAGTYVFYETVDELLAALRPCAALVGQEGAAVTET